MATITEMRGRVTAIVQEIQQLRDLDELTAEQEARADQLVDELNDIGPRIQRANALDAAIGANLPLTESRGRVSGIDPVMEGGRAVDPRDRKSLGLRFHESPELDAFRQANGPTSGSGAFQFGSFFEERAIVNTPLLPTGYLQPERLPGIRRPDDPYGSLRDVLLVGQTNSDALEWYEEASFTNNAAVVGEATATTGTTGIKPESAITFTKKSGTVQTIAHWIPITKQMVWNAPELQSYVEGRLIDGLRLKEDDELLNGDGTSGHLTGLLSTTGIQVLDATYFAANEVADEGTVNELFNRLLRARTLIQSVGRAQANFIVLNPADHEVLMTTTDAQRQYFGAGPFSGAGVSTLWGLRVVINERLDAGTALVGDGRQAMIRDRMQATLSIGFQNDQFVRNMFTILAEERLGLTVFRPSAFAAVELAVTA